MECRSCVDQLQWPVQRFSLMLQDGHDPDIMSCTALVSACTASGSLQQLSASPTLKIFLTSGRFFCTYVVGRKLAVCA
eukprot:3293397-Amphidinium_carterae.1